MKNVLVVQKLNCQHYLKENMNDLLFGSWILLQKHSQVALLGVICNDTNMTFGSFESFITLDDERRPCLTQLNDDLRLTLSEFLLFVVHLLSCLMRLLDDDQLRALPIDLLEDLEVVDVAGVVAIEAKKERVGGHSESHAVANL